MLFLYGYLLWINVNRYVVDENAYNYVYSDLSSYVANTERPDRLDVSDNPKPKNWNGDQYTWETALKARGLYQVIRPSARRDVQNYGSRRVRRGETQEYVLEVLSIDPRESASERITMYSHKAPSSKHMYSGDICQSTWAMFAVLQRTHSHISSRNSFRTIATCVSDPNHYDCFSGMLTRSMSDDTGAGKRVMAAPFVAMRTPYPPNAIHHESLRENASSGLHEIRRSLLVGHLDARERRHRPLLEVCDGLFGSLNPTFHLANTDDREDMADKAIITTSSDNRFLRGEVERHLGGDRNYFERWEDIVADVLSDG